MLPNFIAMMTLIVVIALAVRVVLDLASLVKSDCRFDAAYCVLFGLVAAVLLLENAHDRFPREMRLADRRQMVRISESAHHLPTFPLPFFRPRGGRSSLVVRTG